MRGLVGLEIREEAVTPGALGEHGKISIAFEVDRVLAVTLADGGWGGISLTETPVAAAYVKDYDASEEAGPERWASRFDTSNWGMVGAYRDTTRVGGAVIALRTADLYMLGGRDDVAVLWDIRVAPAHRGTGTGSALFRAAADWAGARSCAWL
jgi:ribosomal protein S18 acetylase RimI-like enzyme